MGKTEFVDANLAFLVAQAISGMPPRKRAWVVEQLRAEDEAVDVERVGDEAIVRLLGEPIARRSLAWFVEDHRAPDSEGTIPVT